MSTSSRDLLHRNQLPAFSEFCSQHGWELLPFKGSYEVLRIKKGRDHFVFYERDADQAKKGQTLAGSTHITVPERAIPLVRLFIKEKRGLL